MLHLSVEGSGADFASCLTLRMCEIYLPLKCVFKLKCHEMCLAVPLLARLRFFFSLFLLSWLLFSLCVCVYARLNLASLAMHYTMRPKLCNENVLAIIYYVAAGVEGNSAIDCCCLLSINCPLAAKLHSALFARLSTVTI